MPVWATELSKKYDSTKLKSSISVTAGAIFLIFLLGEVIDPDPATGARSVAGADTVQLWLYVLLIVTVLAVSIAAWVDGKK